MAQPEAVKDAFEAMLAAGPVLLSGGFGTELQRRGCDTRLPAWAARALCDAPGEVRRLHADYLRAGAQVLTANTFRVGRLDLALTEVALRLTREAVEEVSPADRVLIAGSLGPVADCYRPDLVPSDRVLGDEHAARAAALQDAGADLLLIETMNTVREAVAALEVSHQGSPVLVSFVCGPGGHLLSGEPVAEAVVAVEPYEPRAILVNCCPPPVATEALTALRSATDCPVGVYANGRGRPEAVRGWCFEGGSCDRAYVREAGRWLDLGARLVGGCCGTTPATIAALRDLLGRRHGAR